MLRLGDGRILDAPFGLLAPCVLAAVVDDAHHQRPRLARILDGDGGAAARPPLGARVGGAAGLHHADEERVVHHVDRGEEERVVPEGAREPLLGEL